MRTAGRRDGRVDGLVKIMPLVAPTDQLKLDRADLSVEARCGKNIQLCSPNLKIWKYGKYESMERLSHKTDTTKGIDKYN